MTDSKMEEVIKERASLTERHLGDVLLSYF